MITPGDSHKCKVFLIISLIQYVKYEYAPKTSRATTKSCLERLRFVSLVKAPCPRGLLLY